MLSSAARMWVFCGAVAGHHGPGDGGPPYLTDDPEPTDYKHFEIYNFTNGTATRADTSGEAGIDINYGGAPNLQLTATIPAAYSLAPMAVRWWVASATSSSPQNTAS